MLLFELSNQFMSICVDPTGAELISIKKRLGHTKKAAEKQSSPASGGVAASKELLWQADPLVWARHAPVLFPIVGKLKNDSYSYQNIQYRLPQHGFARDQIFNLVDKRTDTLAFSLKSSEATKPFYPFDFELVITYKLIENSLHVHYHVSTPDIAYFSIGAHPAFILEQDAFESYQLTFDFPENLQIISLDAKSGLPTHDFLSLASDHGKLQLSKDLFVCDTLIFESLKSRKITLSQNDSDILSLSFEGFPYLGIWSKQEKFICLEPWFGIADYIDAAQDLTTKQGIQCINKDTDFNSNYAITLY